MSNRASQYIVNNTPKSLLEPIREVFIADMRIGKHFFRLVCNGRLNEEKQKMWFDSIMEVLGIGVQKQG